MRNILQNMVKKCDQLKLVGVTSLILLPGPAIAQDETDTGNTAVSTQEMATFDPEVLDSGNAASGKPGVLEEIVVTGTLMRGIAPTGAEIISMSMGDIAATGAVTTAELLATIPQNSSFGTTPAVQGADGIQLSVNRVNLRNLPQGIGAASPTLVLMDGHRLVGTGIGQNFPDPDVVPPGALQRVEVLTDGGSSVYGTDAIGGVVNFITRRDYQGAEVGVRQGFGDSYDSSNVDLTIGHDWGDTSAYLAYNYAHNDAIYGGDRDYVKKIDWATGIPLDLACNPGNVTIGAATWAVDPRSGTLMPGTSGKCDTTRYDTIYPEIKRDTLFAGASHDLSDQLGFDLQAWYTKRENSSDEGPLEGYTTVRINNPNYISTGGSTAANTQNVAFNFVPINGHHNYQHTNLEEWGFTPRVRWDISAGWQMRAYFNYGRSETTFQEQGVDAVALNDLVVAGSINPYNVAVSDPAAIARVLNFESKGRGIQELHNAKGVFDGPVYSLPGGDIHVALGAEYIDEYYKGGVVSGPAGSPFPYVEASRFVKAGFAELNIPIISSGNQLPGVYEFTLSASYRYDDYSDFGDTDSTNFAFTYVPLEWLQLRGRWSEGFQAPGLADLANANSTVGASASVPSVLVNPAVPVQPGQWLMYAQGTKLPLEPQTAQNYNVGFDIQVPFVEGLSIGASYYHIEYLGQISIPPVYNPGVFYPTFTDYYLMLPSYEEAEAFLRASGAPQVDVDNALAQVGTNSIYAVLDVRRVNQGSTEFGGYDMFIEYEMDTSFGAVFASFNGSYLDSARYRLYDGAEEIQRAGEDSSRFNATFGLGARIGSNVVVRGTILHQDGYDLSTPAGLNQTTIDAWDTLDLYAQYEFPGQGSWTENLSLSLGLNNVTDEDPPEYRGVSAGNTAGYVGGTLGRVLQLGFNKKF